ncbi:DUF177 domain-containing protein [bacterium]|nr:DUF177 domain-containing protein [bacterium]
MKSKHKHIPVRLSGLTDGQHQLQYTVDPGSIELPAEFRTPLSIDVTLDKAEHQIALRISVRSVAHLPCDRCLDEVDVPVETEFLLVFTHDNSGTSSEEDDVREIPVNDPTVDLAEDVRDAAMLCIPMRVICGEDDNGKSLCRNPIPDALRAERQQREDPRWDTLKSLKLDQ